MKINKKLVIIVHCEVVALTFEMVVGHYTTVLQRLSGNTGLISNAGFLIELMESYEKDIVTIEEYKEIS